MKTNPYYCCAECGSMEQDKDKALDCHGGLDGNLWYWCKKRACYFLEPCKCCE